MPITLSNIQETVERTLFEAIRKVMVGSGYCPDVALRDSFSVGLITLPSTIKIIGSNQTAKFVTGRKFTISGSIGKNGTYTVVSSAFSTDTTIIVAEIIPNATIDGTISIDRYYNDTVGVTLWESDLIAAKNTKGFAIEIFGTGSNFDKYQKKVPRIVIESIRVLPGELGTDPGGSFKEVPGEETTYRKQIETALTSTFHIDVRLVSAGTTQDRIVHSILAYAVGKRKYLPIYNDDTQHILFEEINYANVPQLEFGVMERVVTYSAVDIYETDPIVGDKVISAIKEIKVKFPVQNGDETTNANADDLVVS